MTRRTFVTGAAALGASTVLPAWVSKSKTPIGIQLWSVKADMNANPKSTLRTLKKAGFSYVEGFGYKEGKMFGLPVAEYKKLLSDEGLYMPTAHVNMAWSNFTKDGKLGDAWKKAVEDALFMGQKFIINPFMEAAQYKDLDTFISFCDLMQNAGAYCKDQGIQFGYHNHEFEFFERNGQVLYEVMMDRIDADLMLMEMDMCWVVYGKHNPLELFKKHPKRFRLAHMKDLVQTGEKQTAIIGEGKVNFEDIIQKKRKAGLEYFIVELEHYKTTPLQDVEKSLQALKAML